MKKKDLLKVALLIAIITGSPALPAQAQDQGPSHDQGRSQDPTHTQDSFAYKAPIDTISQAGFYRVILTPEVLAKSTNWDLSDIRISHAGAWPGESGNVTVGAFIPYVLKTDFPTYHGESFIEFPILPAQKEDSVGDIRIGNWSGGSVDSLVVYIHSASVWRNVTLSGSNDGKKWFVIKEHIRLSPLWTDNTNYMVQTIDFPKSNYHYFKFIQEEKGVLPIDIFRAGMVTQYAGSKRYRPIPPPAIAQKDSSNHHSYITLSFRERYELENLTLYIKAPKLYKRRVVIKDNPPDDGYSMSFDLDPAHTSFDPGAPMKDRSLILDIDNEDNAPLVLDKVEASQMERYLLTWLEPGKYELLIGDKHATMPKYDLKYFVDTVSQEPAALMPGALASVNFHPLTPIKPSRDYKGVYLWAAIVAVLLLLISLCLNMLKSIRESRQ